MLTLTQDDRQRRGGGGEARSYLLVLEGDSSFTFPLPRTGEITIGRAPEADLRVNDNAASRRHAQLLVSEDGVRLSDLGSRHGLLVNGGPLKGPRMLVSGDVISLCGATLVFHRSGRPSQTRAILTLSALRQRLEEEIERAVRYGRELSLLCLEFAQAQGPIDRGALSAALSGHLRLIDAVATSGEGLLILLPEIGADALEATAERLSLALSPLCPALRLGGATCPMDGCDADTLLCGAQAAAELSQGGALRRVADTATTLQIGPHAVVVADPAMRRIYELLRKLAGSDLPVLLSGETGAGKELAAAALHHFSRRQERPFLALNCAALPEGLVESELFGHEKGAFSGAAAAKVGLLESANEGSVFLDEVGELPLAIQAKLLRVLETGRLTRVGDVRERTLDIRLIAATNRDLPAEVKAGRFRADLLFRLSAAKVALLPLRDRTRELPVLARSLLAAACARLGRQAAELSAAAMQRLCAHGWPGNVRELKNAMDYAVATSSAGELIEPWHLPAEIADLPAVVVPEAEHAQVETVFRPIEEEVRDLERTRMAQALHAAGGVQTKAAALIGMPLRTFVTKLSQYGLRSGR